MAYPNRLVDLEHFFQRASGYISEMAEEVRLHLDKIARRLVLRFDHRNSTPPQKKKNIEAHNHHPSPPQKNRFDHVRIVPMIPVFAAAFKAKGLPLLLENCVHACELKELPFMFIRQPNEHVLPCTYP